MHLTFSIAALALLFGVSVQAGPLTLAGCPGAAQIPTSQGFAAYRWALGNWGMATQDENGNAIDVHQVSRIICRRGIQEPDSRNPSLLNESETFRT